jgi:hypothetical protein
MLPARGQGCSISSTECCCCHAAGRVKRKSIPAKPAVEIVIAIKNATKVLAFMDVTSLLDGA